MPQDYKYVPQEVCRRITNPAEQITNPAEQGLIKNEAIYQRENSIKLFAVESALILIILFLKYIYFAKIGACRNEKVPKAF